MSFLLELEEAYEELWPVVQNTDGVDRIVFDLDYERQEVTVKIFLEDMCEMDMYGVRRAEHGISVTVTWKTRTATLMNKLRTAIKAYAKNHDARLKQAERKIEHVAAELKDAEEKAKTIQDNHKRVRLLAPTALEELAQQAE